MNEKGKEKGIEKKGKYKGFPKCRRPNFMALLTLSIESALTEAENTALKSGISHGLAGIFGFVCVLLHVSRQSSLTCTQLAG